MRSAQDEKRRTHVSDRHRRVPPRYRRGFSRLRRAPVANQERPHVPQTIKILIAGALLLHGLAHGRALIALVADSAALARLSPIPVRTWLRPSLQPGTAAAIAIPFWLLSTIGFMAASLLFWGSFSYGAVWRQVAISSAIVSTIGIALFSGIWPGASTVASNLDTAIALVLNAAILVLLLWAKWPAETMFDK
jgi:hypothetical protein